MKRHGFQRPFHLLQIIITSATALSVLLFSFLVMPLMPKLLVILGASTYSILLLATAVLWVYLTGSDPTDRLPDPSKFCSICEKEVNEKSRHCARCGRCVFNLDHHCKWLNNCIGEANYRKFVCLCLAYLFLSAVELAFSLYVITDLFLHGDSEDRASDRYSAGSGTITLIKILIGGVIAFDFARFVLIFQLLVFHLYLKIKGKTTYEFVLERMKKKPIVLPKTTFDEQIVTYAHRVEIQNTPPSPKHSANINTTFNDEHI